MAKGGASNAPAPAIQSSVHVQITQTKQRIINLQNQIAAQQAIFLKHQQQQPQQGQQGAGPHGHGATTVNNGGHATTPLQTPQTPTGDFFKAPSDNLLEISGDRDLGAQAISRFQSNWKVFGKDEPNSIVTSVAAATVANEFSRAPGSLSKQPSISTASSLLARSESGNWGLSADESGWPDSAATLASVANGNQARNDMVTVTTPTSSISSAQIQAQAQQAYNSLNDLVPEFEPGKPWKGTRLQNIEDDPTVTPGSIARSPLSISTIKDPMLLNWSTSKMSPSTTADSLTSLSLSSSTWAFTPPSNTTINNYNAADNGNKQANTTVKAGWGTISSESVTNPANDALWSGPITKPRGPPPGLSAQIKNPATTATPTVFWNSDNRSASGWDRQARSTFLLLRNLTPQVHIHTRFIC